MKWTVLYFGGFVILIGGILAAFWKTEVLALIGAFWMGVGLDIAMGLGIMFAVAISGLKENIQLDIIVSKGGTSWERVSSCGC